MTDTELNALAALVMADVEEVRAANLQRERQNYAPAYDGMAQFESVKALEAELKKRGILDD